MSYSFATIKAAISEGFVLAERRSYVSYRGCTIFGHDTSGRGLKGCSFGLRVEIPEDFTSNYLGVQSDKIFGASLEVLIGGLGGGVKAYSNRLDMVRHTPRTLQCPSPNSASSRVVMFEPRSFQEAIQDAREWTDRWFRAHPEALMKGAQGRLRNVA